MSAVNISFRLADYFRFLIDLISCRRQTAEFQMAERRWSDCKPYLADLSGPLTILDVGSGKLRPQYTILRRQGHRVIGVDFANKAGLSVESILYIFARFLYNLGCPQKASQRFADELIAADVGDLPIPDGTFDLVTSVAAFEHFLEPAKVIAELKRVTKPGAVLWIAIHPFPSLSGGHNVSCRMGTLDSLPRGFQPWDHLRKRQHKLTVPLNEWRPQQYIDEFKKYFEVLNVAFEGPEGEKFLTQEIAAELKDYSRQELLNPGLVLTMKRL